MPMRADTVLLPFVLLVPLPAQQDAPPVEFGRIAWQRDFAAATAAARAQGRPVLALFQEVPG